MYCYETLWKKGTILWGASPGILRSVFPLKELYKICNLPSKCTKKGENFNSDLFTSTVFSNEPEKLFLDLLPSPYCSAHVAARQSIVVVCTRRVVWLCFRRFLYLYECTSRFVQFLCGCGRSQSPYSWREMNEIPASQLLAESWVDLLAGAGIWAFWS